MPDILFPKVEELRALVRDILYMQRLVESSLVHGPELELSVQELRVVEFLGDFGPKMMRELAEYLLIAVNTVTSTVDNLERKGFVRRHRAEEDRRVVRVELTDLGQRTYINCNEVMAKVYRGMLETLTSEEQDILLVLFRKTARAGRAVVQASSC